ncbi:MAG TPA: HAD family hydrolase, partial [archaeon]|nr:HAD family hydrolase [archaeon]
MAELFATPRKFLMTSHSISISNLTEQFHTILCLMQVSIGFDLDGTLMDHRGAARAAINRWLTERSWSHAGDAGEAWLRLEDTHFAAFTAGAISFQEQRRRRLVDFLIQIGVEPHDHNLDELFEEYVALYELSWVAFPDVVNTLDLLRESGVMLAVLTNGQQVQQEAKLIRIGIRDRFDVVLASSELPKGKPSQQAFDALCAALSSPANSVLFVGDDLDADVGGALAAGLR